MGSLSDGWALRPSVKEAAASRFSTTDILLSFTIFLQSFHPQRLELVGALIQLSNIYLCSDEVEVNSSKEGACQKKCGNLVLID